jgi:predicted aspartyl protease
MRHRVTAVLVTAVAGVSLAECGDGGSKTARGWSVTQALSVPLIEYRSGNAVQAFVGLVIEGHRYDFLLDTGAAGTIVDARVARRLGLRDDGAPRVFAPLGCRVSSQPVAVRSWRLGRMSLPASTVFTQNLLITRRFAGLPFGGLLGSDFLSRFGTVTIDFARRRLILGGSNAARRHGAAVTVLRRAGFVLAATPVAFENQRNRFLIDTGAAVSLIDAKTATHLRLPVAGPSTRVLGAACRTAITPVRVRGWSVAGVRRAQAVIGRADDVLPESYLRQGIVGIIGTSTLARRGTLTIDYAHGTMVLGGTGD